MSADEREETPLKVLVADDRQFQRRLIAETLRAVRRVEIEFAETSDACIFALSYFQPDLLLIDWDIEGGQGVELVRRMRAGEAGAGQRRVPVVMVTARNKESDVNYARNAGVDEFVLRPFSTGALLRRVLEVRERRRDFVESGAYVGPCRRRRRVEDYGGPLRRVFDAQDKHEDAPELQIRKGLARMYVERIGAQLRALKPGDRDSLRDLCLACGQVSALCGDMNDKLLMSAASSLFNYVKGVGADGKLNTDVVQAHLDALLQLAELPNYKVELRQTVTQQLSVMVTKKLRESAAA
jgi:DNA-binding response OmpR family regulator